MNQKQMRCEKCKYHQEIVGCDFDWCAADGRLNPMNPYEDGFKYPEAAKWCGEFQPKGDDDMRKLEDE